MRRVARRPLLLDAVSQTTRIRLREFAADPDSRFLQRFDGARRIVVQQRVELLGKSRIEIVDDAFGLGL